MSGCIDSFRSGHHDPCKYKHTPISPIKDDVRSEWMWECDRTKVLMTISHAALSTANILRWSGPILVIDIDPIVVNAVKRMREGQFPRLNILPPILSPIQDMIPMYIFKHGIKDLGVIDLDLTGSLPNVYPILMGVLEPLLLAKWKGKIYLTFNERNDSFHETEDRMAWLRQGLPSSVLLCKPRPYLSDRWDENARLKPGSNMCIVGLQVG